MRATFALFLGAAFVLASCDPPKSSTPKAWHVSTFAGNRLANRIDGTGTAASFASPISIAKSGNTLYVIGTSFGAVRTITIDTAAVNTIVRGHINGGNRTGNGLVARITTPSGVAVSGTSLYTMDRGYHYIRKVAIGATATDTTVSNLAGNGATGHANGVGTAAQFNISQIAGMATDGTTLYIADNGNHRIRAVVIATQTVSDFAGSGTAGHANGAGTVARFNEPAGIVIDGKTLYIADANNHRIRAVDIATKTVSDFAGSGVAGHANGPGATARFNKPRGIATDGKTLYIADANNHRIRAVDIATKTVSDFAGSGAAGYANGAGTAAQFNKPMGIATDGKTLYIADTRNHRIRAVDIATKTVRDIAGNGTAGHKEGVGSAAQFNSPTDLAIDGNTLYVADLTNYRIRKIEYK